MSALSPQGEPYGWNIQSNAYTPYQDTQPFTCPVCSGRGMVAPGFYSGPVSSSVCEETCRSCDGRGIVWR